MRKTMIALFLSLGLATPALAQLAISFSSPGVHIGVTSRWNFSRR